MMTDIIYPAQGATLADIAGVWQLVSWQCDGLLATSNDHYTQFTILRADGRFYWAHIIRRPDGRCVVDPIECGLCRFAEGNVAFDNIEKTDNPGKASSSGCAVTLTSLGPDLMQMALMQEHYVWRRRTDIPPRLTDHIIDCCRAVTTPDLHELIEKYCLGGSAESIYNI